MKLSRRNMLRVAGSSGLVIVGGALVVGQERPAYASQSQWRWCSKCQGLYFAGGSNIFGVCPASPSGHGAQPSGNYSLLFASDAGSGQTNWRWCSKCQGLYFAGGSNIFGVCPASLSGHGAQPSGNYKIESGSVGGGQNLWRWCFKCQGFWFSGSNTFGVCPASPSGHGITGSGDYQLRFV